MSNATEEIGAFTRPGAVIAGRYEIESVIGSGMMGVVVAARHRALDRRVAIKFLRAAASDHETSLARFFREARALAEIESEHAVQVLDLAQLDDGTPYMVMEHLVGIDLEKVLETRGALPISEAVGHLLQACEAIAEAHHRGIIHRDLKPANIFLTRRADGTSLIKVLDFGICKSEDGGLPGIGSDDDWDDRPLTDTGDMLGSPLYMSPEQIQSTKTIDCRTDVWALGVILHQLVTAKLPFRPAGCLVRILEDAPTRLRVHLPGAPAELEHLILRCLEKNVDRRVANIAELSQALLAFAPPDAEVSSRRIAALGNRRRATARVRGSVEHAPARAAIEAPTLLMLHDRRRAGMDALPMNAAGHGSTLSSAG